MFYQQTHYPDATLGPHHVYHSLSTQAPPPYGRGYPHQTYQQPPEMDQQQQNSVSVVYHPYYHDDPAAFAYFQQELSSPKLQGVMMKQPSNPRRSYVQNDIMPPPPPVPPSVDELHADIAFQPPQPHPALSPTLATYFYENANGWVQNYYEANRHHLSPRVQTDVHVYQPSHSNNGHTIIDQPSFGHDYSMILQQQHHQLHHQQHLHHLQQPASHFIVHTSYPASLPAHQQVVIDHPSSSYLVPPPPAAYPSRSNPMLSPRSTAVNQLNQLMSSASLTMPALGNNDLVLPPFPTTECQDEWRENILQYAHNLYATSPQSPVLLSILHALHGAFPNHLPTLLLLACVYYTHRDYQSSLDYNNAILEYDPNYVEAMSNIGTTLRSLGRTAEAERWWYKAVELRPGYWDAVENLVGVLCSLPDTNAKQDQMNSPKKSEKLVPRFKEALGVCEYVERYFFHNNTQQRPVQLPTQLPVHQLPRLQNLFYAKGNLKYALGDILGAVQEYEKGLDIVFGGLDWATVVRQLALVCSGAAPSVTTNVNGTRKPSSASTPVADIPLILLQPDQAAHLMSLTFSASGGILPGLFNAKQLVTPTTSTPSASRRHHTNTNINQASSSNIIQQANQTTSTIMLTLAKLYQDLIHPSSPALALASSTLGTQCPTLAILLPLYYISLALHPSPSTANNLGIILSNLPGSVTANAIRIVSNNNQLSDIRVTSTNLPAMNINANQPISGTMLAMQYYMFGLQLDAKHPHLYTNLGSLLKDMGHLNEAISMYEKAVEYNPKFDVALANLGNAIKDMGRVQDSVQWYRRAVEVNPNFVDAVCGLINALCGVCDWRGRGYTWLTSAKLSTSSSSHLLQNNAHQRHLHGVHDPGYVDNYGNWQPLLMSSPTLTAGSGWMARLVSIVEQQLDEGAAWGAGHLVKRKLEPAAGRVSSKTEGMELLQVLWDDLLLPLWTVLYGHDDRGQTSMPSFMAQWEQRLAFYMNDDGKLKAKKNEGGWLVRLVERITRRLQRHWYLSKYGQAPGSLSSTAAVTPMVPTADEKQKYARPALHTYVSNTPLVPTVLPFHTFTYPLSARQVRLISHRNALRISHATLSSAWLPTHVYPPPPPPAPRLKIGYVSSDFNNHPLAHLMQSVFGFHDRARCEVFCYATTTSDQSPYRRKIEQGSEHFTDVSAWSNQQVVDQILRDGIHVLVNLNGYTKGARNEIFAARPCPVQCSFMGFAGTLGGGWCDWIIADHVVCPPSMVSCEQWRQGQQQQPHPIPSSASTTTSPSLGDLEGDLDPESDRDDFVYTEKFIYMPHSYFVNDHKQGFREEDDAHLHAQSLRLQSLPRHTPNDQAALDEERWRVEESKRWKMRRELFPDLPDDCVIFANFNQLYKLDPSTFRLWLRILARVPNSILWLLRFPPAGENHLRHFATTWAGPEVSGRVVFTDVAPKHVHIHRGRVADIFLDTPECNAHTTAADILWSGTPIVTFPKYEHKMCSRVGASIAYATGFGQDMVVLDEQAYETKVIQWAQSLSYYQDETGTRRGMGNLMMLRKQLFLTRETSRLFDTHRWTRNLEAGYFEAWRRWVLGYEFEDLLRSPPTSVAMSEQDRVQLSSSGCIWVKDPDDEIPPSH
ncbi:TPR-like protein [Hesseltinella vesiculosa]|uniref:protein O-GlcNAc transferase n=1 Tax=Hesseltinella vesiculosa TaxID=101127 RepID=A0A1X2GKX2_9FUNG|nr:TPR-like protein [Hesseltinella vesiculosa]